MSGAGIPRTFGDSYVYRVFDTYGLLLYIGCSQNVDARMAGHRGQPWLPYLDTVTIVGPWPRKQAMARENAAIESEGSYFNCTRGDNGRTKRNRDAVARVMDQSKPVLDHDRLFDTAYIDGEWGPAYEEWSRECDREQQRLAENGYPYLTEADRLARYLAAREAAEQGAVA